MSSCLVSFIFYFTLILGSSFSESDYSDANLAKSIQVFKNWTDTSDFRVLNLKPLRRLMKSHNFTMSVNPNTSLSNEEYVTVTVSGEMDKSEEYWVAMITSNSTFIDQDGNDNQRWTCRAEARVEYSITGDFSTQPLLCYYSPVKVQYLKNDMSYLNCSAKVCSASITFHVINFRTTIQFVLFSGKLKDPCYLASSNFIKFKNPNEPLYGHLSSVDSSATSMRVTWVSGDQHVQQVRFGANKTVNSSVTTFTQNDMSNATLLGPWKILGPAKDYGFHKPGYIHSAVMTNLMPSSSYNYTYGSDFVGWSSKYAFRTLPQGGSNDNFTFIAYGDMGKTPRDLSIEHYIQPGALSVTNAVLKEIIEGDVGTVFHIGDMSYATGFTIEWDFFFHQIFPIASRVPYMSAMGNHERDFPDSYSVYDGTDSGGEIGVPYETYFRMPTCGKDKPWYSIEHANVHFVVISTENYWHKGSEQYKWMKNDLGTVNRTKTPWVILMGHRPMYSSIAGNFLSESVDEKFVEDVEPLLYEYKVDLGLFGHVHAYEVTCPVYREKCLGNGVNVGGVITYYNLNATIHAVIGMAGFTLDEFKSTTAPSWSSSRIVEFGYSKVQVTRSELLFQFINSNTSEVGDSFRIIKNRTY